MEHSGDRKNFVQERREQRHKQTKKNSFQAGTEVSPRYNAIFSDLKSDIQWRSLTYYQKILPSFYDKGKIQLRVSGLSCAHLQSTLLERKFMQMQRKPPNFRGRTNTTAISSSSSNRVAEWVFPGG
jgi:hypothetical protein